MAKGKTTILKISMKMLTFGEVVLNDYFHYDGIYWQKHDHACARALAHFTNADCLPYKGFENNQRVHAVTQVEE